MARVRPSQKECLKVSQFYGGRCCVVTGHPVTNASLHHLDGNPSFSEFPNLLPLSLDLHTGLKIGSSPRDWRNERKEESLSSKANDHFRQAKVAQAYGCLRLAYSLSAFFRPPASRDLDREFSLAAYCLFCLRRMGARRIQLVYANLSCMLDRCLEPTLSKARIIRPYGEFCLLVELASWLNEFGWPKEGSQFLGIAGKRLKDYQKQLSPQDTSRFHRQLANGLIQNAHYSKELINAFSTAESCGDNSENNEFAIYNTQLNLHISRGEYRKALKVLDKRFSYLEKRTDDLYGLLTAMQQTVQTSFGYIALSLLCEGQVAPTKAQLRHLRDRFDALDTQEQRYGFQAQLNYVPGLKAAATEAARNLPFMRNFIDNRTFPKLPKAVVNSIRQIARKL